MENKKEDKSTVKSVPIAEKSTKPDSAAGLLVQASLRISDPVTGRIILQTRG